MGRAEEAGLAEALHGALYSYKSGGESKDAADALFRKELEKGFVHWSNNKAELEKTHGCLVQPSIGYIAKIKLD